MNHSRVKDRLMLPTLPGGYAPDISQAEVDLFFQLVTDNDQQSMVPLETDPKDTGLQIFADTYDLQSTLGADPEFKFQDPKSVPIIDVDLSNQLAADRPAIQPRCGCNMMFFKYWKTSTAKRFHDVVLWPPFDNFVLFIIICSSIALSLENPFNTPTEKLMLFIGDYIWLVVFSVEGIIKVVALGPSLYWEDEWNRLDILVLLFTYFSMFGPKDSQAGVLRLFRIGRTLRPLRMINKNPEMKQIINSIISSLPAVTNALILACFAFFVFAVFGLNSFMGLLHTCNEGDLDQLSCHGSADMENEGGDEFLMPIVWANRRNNFDNIFVSLLTLYEAATTEGWVDLMYACMDIDGEIGDGPGSGKPPIFNNQPEAALYWVFFIFICTFFIVQLFVGVIIDNYNREMNVLTESQKRWVLLKRVMLNMGPDPLSRPKQWWRLPIYSLVRTEMFDWMITAMVIINVAFIAMTHYGQSETFTQTLAMANLFFVGAFAFEMLLKLVAFGPAQYINDSWNCFDGSIVVGSILMLWFNAGAIAQIGRAFRIARLLKIVKKAKGLKTLFNTMLTSLPSMGNISMLMFLLYFVYAVIGITLFGQTKFGDNYTKDANFRDFPQALLLLFRMSTGENWHEIMGNCQIGPPTCTGWGMKADCGMSEAAAIYFCSFFMFGVYLMLNLFIAVIIDNFANVYNKDNNIITTEHLEEFQATWRKFDREATGGIPFENLRSFVGVLEASDNAIVRGLLQSKILYGLMYADMRHDAKKRRDAKQGGLVYDKIGTMNIEEIMAEMKGDEMHKDDRVNFNKLLESCAIIQMGMTSMDYYERVVMEEKQRTLKIEVAASLIGSTIRGYLARQKRQRELLAASRREQFLKATDQEIQEKRRQDRQERKGRKDLENVHGVARFVDGAKKRRKKKKKDGEPDQSGEGEPLLDSPPGSPAPG